MTFHSLAFEANYVCATTLIGFLAPGSEIAFLFDIFVIVLEAASHRLHVCFGNLLLKKRHPLPSRADEIQSLSCGYD